MLKVGVFLQKTRLSARMKRLGGFMYRIYCIKDKLSGKCGPLQLCENEAVAQRMFNRSFAGSPEEYKEDFELCFLGFFEEKTCKILLMEVNK